MKKILLLSLALIASFYAMAYDFSAVCSSGQTLYYTITSVENKTVEIVPQYNDINYSNYTNFFNYTYYYTQPTGDFIFPANVTYNAVNYTITSIGEHVFHCCSGLRGNLTLPGSVISVGADAFCSSGFYGNLTLPGSVISIGDEAFYGCNKLVGNLTIPASVTSLGNGAFSGCNELFSFNVDPGNKRYSSSDGIIYSIHQDTVVAYPNGKTGSLIIPASVTSIGNSAFSNCEGFTGSLTIPGSVKSIGRAAFSNIKGLTGSLIIPNSVISIGDGAFNNCESFTGSLTLPGTVTTIGESAFWGCTGFTGTLTIPGSVTSIGVFAFYGCSGLTGSITIPASVTSFGRGVFLSCPELTAFIVEPGNKRYSSSNGIIYSLDQDTIVACPIGKTGNLIIPSSVTTIGEDAFFSCTGLTGSLTIPQSVTTIGGSAFQDCSGFSGKLTIPNSVTAIEGAAFFNCTGFAGSLTIPNTVTSIGEAAFQNCPGISSVYVYSFLPLEINGNVFAGINYTNCPLYVPAGSKSAYSSANSWKYFLNIVEMTTAAPGINNTAIKIYPNPVTAYFQIEGIEGTTMLLLSDSNGKVLLQKYIVNNEKIATKNIGSGSYIVKVNTDQGIITTKMIKK